MKDILLSDSQSGSKGHEPLGKLINWYFRGKSVPSAVRILQNLSLYLWPRDHPSLKLRVVAALALLISAKLINITVPCFYKYGVDALAVAQRAGPSGAAAAAAGLPLMAVAGYGGARCAAVAFTELRTAVFAKVTQHAIRRISLRIFEHIHTMDLGFHLGRQTGAVSRTLDRGTRGIQVTRARALEGRHAHARARTHTRTRTRARARAPTHTPASPETPAAAAGA